MSVFAMDRRQIWNLILSKFWRVKQLLFPLKSSKNLVFRYFYWEQKLINWLKFA